MCENKTGTNGSFLRGAVFGVALGALAGVLLAPQSGAQTKKKLKSKGMKYLSEGKETYTTIRTEVDPYILYLEERLHPILEELKKASGPAKQELVKKIQNIISECENLDKNSAEDTK